MLSHPTLPGQITSVKSFLEDFCLNPDRVDKEPKVVVKKLTDDFIKKYSNAPEK